MTEESKACLDSAPPTSDVLDGWLTRAELAAVLGVSVSTLAKWATEGRGPVHIRVGSRCLYRAGSCREWLEQMEGQKRRARG